jgi:uncharacterized protein Smg (DUF494 family)
MDRSEVEEKLALAEQRVAGGEQLVSDMEDLRMLLAKKGFDTTTVSDLLNVLRVFQRTYEQDRDRFVVILKNVAS